jgi:hypothetical protein
MFCQLQNPAPDVMSPDFSVILSNFNFSTATAMDSVTSMQEIFELDGECNVILQGRIGQVNSIRTVVPASRLLVSNMLHSPLPFHIFPSIISFHSNVSV